MISVAQALEAVLSLGTPLKTEVVPLRHASGRVLRKAVTAERAQPPFSSSAMDGYAIQDADHVAGNTLRVIGEAAAGHRFEGVVQQGQAVRIFTGAPLPHGATRVVIQEDVTGGDSSITLGTSLEAATHIRPAGGDFKQGHVVKAPKRLTPADVALLASMNLAEVTVSRRPAVALLATGDELVMPGEAPNDDQIIASNTFGLAAMLQAAGATARMLPIARDNEASLRQSFDLARGADLIVTVGGASVGDHDLVGVVAADMGLERAFYKVAMRPGKPLMAGKINGTAMLGLPGNPVSAIVCGEMFLKPLIDQMLGLPATARETITAPTNKIIPANGPREHYMRGRYRDGTVKVFDRQDSSLLKVLHVANCLIKRAPHAPEIAVGAPVEIILI